MATSLTKKGLKVASDKVIVAARPALEFLKGFTTDFSAEAVRPGTGVAVDVLTATAETFDKTNANYRHGTGTIKNVLVATDIRKKATFNLDDLDCLEDETSHLWNKFGEVAGKAVGKALVASVMDKLTYSARTGAAITLGGTTLADFFGLKAAIEEKGIAADDCSLLLTPAKYAALCAALGYNTIGNSSVVDAGEIGARLGFKAICNSPNAKIASAADANLGCGFIVPTGAVAVVNRVVKPAKGVGGELLDYGEFTDELSGLTLTSRVVNDASTGDIYWTVEGLFGSKLTLADSNGAPGFYQIVTAA